MMNLVADWLLVAAMIGLGYAALTLAMRLPVAPLREIVIANPLVQVTSTQLEYAARTGVAGNFFTVNLDKVRAAFEKLPWVRRVEIRRVWPAVLELEIEEHRAAALWKPGEGETRLVSDRGEVFSAASGVALPVFAGPEGSAPEVLRGYRTFAEILTPLGREPHGVSLSPRLAWQLRLDDGLLIDLGRDQPKAPIAERLRRFAAVYREALAKAGAPVTLADLRYPAGFALRPAQPRNEAKTKR